LVGVYAVSRSQINPQQYVAKRANGGVDDILEFLKRELPPGNAKQAPYLAEAVQRAAARYDRYAENRSECLDYAARRRRLVEITKAVEELAAKLCNLDILSRDELANRIDANELAAFVGSLHFLRKETTDLAQHVQINGRPRDLPEERWITELAGIYENAFDKPARVSGSGDDKVERRGKFYRLLEVGRPGSFPATGKLSVRQIDRVLKHRRKKKFRRSRSLSPDSFRHTKIEERAPLIPLLRNTPINKPDKVA
jgi:hypothetical protein